ncbi:pentatricopeptide repeat-containing protein At2g17210-like [Phragmites australis]|uniref:pentatricopeptide repeat-containing protein At2g17210-like n=1 Tax=Phragmites australis TaxID=29695 RepID=UPI002D783B6D|nr:pentatricopeptide repeat-containing protein At2g17210-like [Phragmites australis]
MMMHAYLLKTAYIYMLPVANSLLANYASQPFGGSASASKLFDDMPLRDHVSWTSIINAYLPALAQALRLFRDVHLGTSLHGLVTRRGLHVDVFNANSLIHMYSEGLRLRSTRKVFDSIANKNGVSWNTMLSGLLGKKLAHPLCCRSVHAVTVRKLLLMASVLLLNALLDVYAKCGLVKHALRLFRRMPFLNRNLISWSTVIAACTRNGKPHEAITCFATMREAGQRPNSITMLSLLEACANRAEMRASRCAYGMVLRSGMALEQGMGNTLVDMYDKCGDLAEARRVFNAMLVKDVLSWNSMIGALGMNGRALDALALLGNME